MDSVESLCEEDGDMYDMLQASTDKKSLLDKLDACQNLSGNAIDLVLPTKRAKTEPNIPSRSNALTEHKIEEFEVKNNDQLSRVSEKYA